jgi:hypothetical protein
MTQWSKFYLDGPSEDTKFAEWIDEMILWLNTNCNFRIKAKAKTGYGKPDNDGWTKQTTLVFLSFKSLADATLFKMVYYDWIISDNCARGLVTVTYDYDFEPR